VQIYETYLLWQNKFAFFFQWFRGL